MTDNRLRIGGIRPPTGGRVCMKAQLFASASAAALFALPATAMAQSSEAAAPADTTAQGSARDGARDDHDIIVTATRRTARLQDVPLSVTAFGQEQLDDLGIVGYEGIAQNTPGIVVNRQTQNFNNFTARGINHKCHRAGLQMAGGTSYNARTMYAKDNYMHHHP